MGDFGTTRTFKLNVKANIEGMAGESRFTDVKENETKIFRFAPPVTENGLIFYKTVNHYKLKTDEGRGIALADLREHGTDATGHDDYLARLSDILDKHGNAVETKIGKAIRGNARYYAQGWEATRMDDGSFKYSKCKLLSLPKTAAEAVIRIFKNQELVGEPNATDPESGQAILISREGTGFNTKYAADRSGVKVALDGIVPGWREQLFNDVYEAVMLNIYSPADQKAIAQITYPELDWEKLEKEFGL